MPMPGTQRQETLSRNEGIVASMLLRRVRVLNYYRKLKGASYIHDVRVRGS